MPPGRTGRPRSGRKKGEVALVPPATEALGRSRGGFTTKIHAAASDDRTALVLTLTPGQAGDAPEFDALLDAVPAACPVGEAVMDKGYDSDDIRETLVDRDIAPVIPPKANRVEPIWYDEERYKERNKVERLFNRIKQFRRVATRYDKLATTFLAVVQITAAFQIVR